MVAQGHFRSIPGGRAMSVIPRFCCRSPLQAFLVSDSVTVTALRVRAALRLRTRVEGVVRVGAVRPARLLIGATTTTQFPARRRLFCNT